MIENKRRLSDRITLWLAWTAIGSATAPFVLPIVAVSAWLAISVYLEVWRSHYGLGCSAHTISDVLSPSGRWTARARRVHCFTISRDPATNQWIQVVLISNDRPRVFARYREVFYRFLGDERPRDGGRIALKWTGDYALEIDTPPCEPACERADNGTPLLAPTGIQPCDAECRNETRAASVRVSVKPPQS
jgi:hypothetical protein